jgi:hypothetical protein
VSIIRKLYIPHVCLLDTPLYFLLGVLKSLSIVADFHVPMFYLGSSKVPLVKNPKHMTDGLA